MTSINTNLKALLAQEAMRNSNTKLSTAMERLSTGLRINSAKDDAAGLAISNRMTAQVRGFAMATKNANDGISMAQTADGAYGQVTSMLQRMRELAVQAANGSMTKSDRESIQLEIDELKMEIQGVATKTNFNGINLLDGSAQNIKLQTGTKDGDLMSIGFGSVQTKDIGSGAKPALTSVGGIVTTFGALSSGQIVLNGVVVGASLRTDDNLSFETAGATTSLAASAIAKAAAINRVSEQSGVVAKVNDTNVIGSAMTASAAVAAAAITINGVETAQVALGTDASTNRNTLVGAINAIAQQTGVQAIDTGEDSKGITLFAQDGRNITLLLGTGQTAGNTGLGASGTYVGTYSLYSESGGSITIDREPGDTALNSGLAVGTYAANTAQVVTQARAAIQSSASSPNVLAGNTLVINGVSIGPSRVSDDTASYAISTASATNKAASAIAIAAAINAKAAQTGVAAVAEANVIRGSGDALFTAGSSGSVFINGTRIQVNTATSNNVIDSINQYSGQTGVIASAFGTGVELRAEDGRNIHIAHTTAISAGNLGLAGVTIVGTAATEAALTATAASSFYASVSLKSDKVFTVARGDQGNSVFEDLGFRLGTFGGKDTGLKISEINVSSQQGAGFALTAIDGAINMVAASQARSGAFQNRLESAINVLAEQSENAQAARSRILDTDYALETTNMAKQMIVQQAATAMLAQANQQQQLVLALLQ